MLTTRLTLFAQDPFIKNFTQEDGIPSALSYQVLQDRQGYMWMCTNNGVIKFDGNEFDVYNLNNGFPDYGAFHMVLDKFNRLWFVTFSGKVCYFRDNKFITVKLNKSDSTQARWICQNNIGDIFISTCTGNIYKVNRLGEVAQYINVGHCIFVMECLNDSTLVMTNGDSYRKIDAQKKQTILPITTLAYDYPRIGVLEDGLALSSTDGIIKYHDKNNSFDLMIPVKQNIYPFDYLEDKNYLWVSHKNGLSKYEKGKGQYKLINHYNKNRQTTSVIRDNTGKIWFTNYFEGLNLMINERVKLYQGEVEYNKRTQFLTMMPGKNSVALLNSMGQIYEINNNHIFLKSEIVKGNSSQLFLFHQAQISDNEHLINIDNKVFCYNTSSGKAILSDLQVVNTSALYYSDSDYFYILGRVLKKDVFFSRLDKKNKKILTETKLKLDGISNFKSFTVDQHTTAWFGNKEGLWYIDNGIPKSLKRINTYTSHITCDKQNRIWACTLGKGVFCVDASTKKILLHLTTANGLNTNICHKIIMDINNNIWISSYEGLTKISSPFLNSRRILHFDNNILPSNVILDILTLKNIIYVATSKGIIECPINISIPPASKTPTYITRVELEDTVYTDIKNILIPFGKSFQIHYTNLSFGIGKQRKYQYRLKSSNEEKWEYTSSSSVKYDQLEPGNYVFEVAGINAENNSKNISYINIKIIPLYWQTWWFKTFIIAAFALIFSLITVVYFTARNKETLSNKKLVESQLNSLRAQINPHFIFNSLNSIQDFILDQQPRMANLYLSKFASLMRMIIENSRKEYTLLSEEIDFLKLYISLEKLRLNEELDVDFIITPETDVNNIQVPTMLLQPIIENAIKHGLSPKKADRFLSVKFETRADKALTCTIEDNGIGRNLSKSQGNIITTNRSSVGLRNIHERLELLFGIGENIQIIDLMDEKKQPAGTRVVIHVQHT